MKRNRTLGVVFVLTFGILACSIFGSPAPLQTAAPASPSHPETAPTRTPQATPTPLPPPTPGAQPQAGEGISAVVSADIVRWHNLPYGSLEFIGLMSNKGRKELKSVEVVVILEDDSGRAVAAAFSYIEVGLLRPGEASPFRVVFPDLPPAWREYQILFQGGTAEYIERCREFEVLSQTLENSGSGTNEIKGEIKNTGAETCEYIRISAAFYDAGGNLVGVGSTYARREQVKPGETSRFELLQYDSALGGIDHFELWVEGTPKQ